MLLLDNLTPFTPLAHYDRNWQELVIKDVVSVNIFFYHWLHLATEVWDCAHVKQLECYWCLNAVIKFGREGRGEWNWGSIHIWIPLQPTSGLSELSEDIEEETSVTTKQANRMPVWQELTTMQKEEKKSLKHLKHWGICPCGSLFSLRVIIGWCT
jgi:hypothetical protein